MTKEKTENQKVVYVRPEDFSLLKERSKKEGRAIAEIIHRLLTGANSE